MIDLPDLEWFPKAFGAGDTDGKGAKRMLGQPDVNLQNLLVRETAQNSWDAACPGEIPVFEIRHRVLDADVRDVLTWNVFRSASKELGLLQALGEPTLEAIEIVDRGTKGLGGPTRNDIELPQGTITDYADFVLTIGAPPDHQHGGGTYGFGKTASYLASRCSTIVIWSRAWDAERQMHVERFIASAMGPSFSIDGQRFTGRQWWALPADDETTSGFRFEPVSGEDARRLGRAVFERHFSAEETGTSLLILQPHPADGDEALVQTWSSALLDNLWPKLVIDQPDDRRMHATVWSEGHMVTLPIPEASSIWQGKRACLDAIRTVQSGQENLNPLITVEVIESFRPKAVLGHLALTHVPDQPGDPMASTADSVTYMRSGAELVVKAQPFGPSTIGGYRWVGVFKPTPEKDPAFAMSEPPAHDNWNPEGMEDKAAKSSVSVALRRIRSKVAEFLTPKPVSTAQGEAASTGAVSAALAGLAGSGEGSRATETSSSSSGVGTQRTTRVAIDAVRLLPLDEEDRRSRRQRTAVTLMLHGPSRATVHASVLSFAVDGGSLASDDQVVLDSWVLADGSTVDSDQIDLSPNKSVEAIISYPRGLAINFNFAARGL